MLRKKNKDKVDDTLDIQYINIDDGDKVEKVLKKSVR